MKNRPLLLDPVALGGWSEDFVSTAALWWEFNVQQGRNARRSFGPELYCEVRFESLVTRPGEVCTTHCMFLGLPYSKGMVKFYEKEREKGLLTHFKSWLALLAVPDAIGRCRNV
jgi:hypothetical protein